MRSTEEARFDEFVASRYDRLRRAAFVLCGDAHHAEDLVQTAFLRLHRSWKRVAHVEDLDAYMHVTLVNTSRAWWKRSWHGEVAYEVLPEPIADERPLAAVHDRDAVVRALANLPRAQREVLVLRYLGQLSEAETAAALSTSVGTVKSRTSRALSALRATEQAESMDKP